MAYVGSSIKVSDLALQSASKAASLMRKSQQANIPTDDVMESIVEAHTALGRYVTAATKAIYQEGAILTVAQVAAPTTFTPIVSWARTNEAFDYWGSKPGTVNGSYTGPTVGSGRQFKTEFETDSNNVAFKVLNTGSHLQVYVDGTRVSDKDIVMNGGVADSLVYVIEVNLVPMLDSAGNKVFRHISLTGYNHAFGAAWTDSTATIRKPIGPLAVSKNTKAWQLGDSYTLGVGPTDPSYIDFRQVCDHLGWVGLANGISQSGWNSTGGQVPATRVTSELGSLSYLPDYVILALGYNDAGGNITTLQASMRATIAAVRAIVPQAKIIAYGPATPLGGTANLLLIENAVKAVSAEAGVSFISLYNVVNSGNSKFHTLTDNVHPTDAGHRARARVISSEIVKFI